jgi:microcystin-dependent protein
MKKSLLACLGTAAIGLLCLSPGTARAQAYKPFIGEIQTFAFGFCPSGWLPLNGQLLPISQFQVLFDLLGTTYGGDGVNTFALPLVKPPFTEHPRKPLTQCISFLGVFPSQS